MGLLFLIMLVFCILFLILGILLIYGGYRVYKRNIAKKWKGIIVAAVGGSVAMISVGAIMYVILLLIKVIQDWPY